MCTGVGLPGHEEVLFSRGCGTPVLQIAFGVIAIAGAARIAAGIGDTAARALTGGLNG